jgi:hypothetical protein
MTDFKVGDVVKTPCNRLVRIEQVMHHGVFVLINTSSSRKSRSAAYLSKCKLATGADRARFKAMRLEDLRNVISSLREDIIDLEWVIEEEEKMA